MCEHCEPAPPPPPSTEPLEGYAAIAQEWYIETIVAPKLTLIIRQMVWERMMNDIKAMATRAY